MKKISLALLMFTSLFFMVHCENDVATDSGDYKAYPNPYNPSEDGFLKIATISGSGFELGTVSYTIYDYNEKEIYNQEVDITTSATANVTWAGIDMLGRTAAPGLYYIHLQVTDSVAETVETALIEVMVE